MTSSNMLRSRLTSSRARSSAMLCRSSSSSISPLAPGEEGCVYQAPLCQLSQVVATRRTWAFRPGLLRRYASHPRWIPGYQIQVLDGNHLAATEHRLQALRGTWAAPLPGQALVVLDQQRMLITDVIPIEDGHAQERSMIAQVLHLVEADQLWIEDRTFCTMGLMFGMARRGAAFVVRQHGQVQGELVGRLTRQRASRSGAV